jgi:hypothetical protein
VPEGTIRHTFPSFDVPSGYESWDQCQSWTLGNTEPVYVRSITARNGGGFHHSNWFYTRDTNFRGDDGTWPCAERGFDEVAAGILGGTFFAQSTQAVDEVQEFPPGTAIRMPITTRILGGIHLLNTTPSQIDDTAIQFDLETVPEAEVMTPLLSMGITNTNLAIDPRSESSQVVECDMMTPHMNALDRPPDFKIYYVLPHYHALGVAFRFELTGGTRDGEVIYETTTAIGEPLGATLDPPVDVTGATGLRMTCTYDNPRDEAVQYGVGDQEMCVLLAYTDSTLRFGGRSTADPTMEMVGGIPVHTAPCDLFGAGEI